MDYQEFSEKRKLLKKIIDDLELQYVYSKTNLRIGDTIKFKKRNELIGDKNIVYTEKIYGFEVSSVTEIIYAICGNHQTPNIANCSKVRVTKKK